MKTISVFFQSKVFFWIVVVAVIATVMYAFFLVGSPSQQRAIQFDQRRISDLQQISYAVLTYWDTRGRLPKSLEEIKNDKIEPAIYLPSVQDPRTGEPYEYRVLGEKTYELCAVFETESSSTSKRIRKPVPAVLVYLGEDSRWDHGIGRACFQREVSKQRTP